MNIINKVSRLNDWHLSKNSPFTKFFTKDWNHPPPFLYSLSYGKLVTLLNKHSKSIKWGNLFTERIRTLIDDFQARFLGFYRNLPTNYLRLRHKTREDSAHHLKAMSAGTKIARELNAKEDLEERKDIRDIEDKKWILTDESEGEGSDVSSNERNDRSEVIPRYPFLDLCSTDEDTDGSIKSFVVSDGTPLPTSKKRKLTEKNGENRVKDLKVKEEADLEFREGKDGKMSGHKRRIRGKEKR